MANELRADGGVFQINHPVQDTTYPENMDWSYRYEVVPDVVEVWNISTAWQPPAPSGASNDDALDYWDGWLDRGYEVGATGGSDNHYVATSGIQGNGQPTTWVFAEEAGEAAILEGLREGRTFVSWQPPRLGGPRLFLEGDADGDGTYESIVGDRLPEDAELRVRVLGAPGSQLRIVGEGGQGGIPVIVPTADYEFRFPSPGGKWVRAELFEPDAADQRRAACDEAFGGETTYCRNRITMLALTSPIYLGPATQP